MQRLVGGPHENWLAVQTLESQCISSEESLQSSSPSQRHVRGMHLTLPVVQLNSSGLHVLGSTTSQPSSSEPSPQSFSLSHFHLLEMHLPFLHWNCSAAHF